jgi:hypothetical protein
MLSMACKKALLYSAVAVGALTGSSMASATGIPVFCYNCQEATNNAAQSILDGLRMQTEALINGMDYTLRAQEKLATAREVAMGSTAEKIKNSYAMEPSLGAKPRTACGQYGAASLRAMGVSSAPKLRNALTQRTQAHNNQGRNLAPGEPRRDYANNQILALLDDEKTPVNSGEIIMSDEPVSASDPTLLEKLRQLFELILNPYPVEMPPEEDVKRIKASGSPKERSDLAQAVALQKRQEVGQYIHDEAFEKNIQRLDPSTLQYMIKDTAKYLSDDQAAALKGKISPNQLNELMATYRVRSDEWVKAVTTSPSEEMARRESLLINAEILNQTWEMNQNLTKLLKMSSFGEVRKTSKDGMISR